MWEVDRRYYAGQSDNSIFAFFRQSSRRITLDDIKPGLPQAEGLDVS